MSALEAFATSARLETSIRLDKRKKELTAQKEELLRQSKAKLAAQENVKSHIEKLLKVRQFMFEY